MTKEQWFIGVSVCLSTISLYITLQRNPIDAHISSSQSIPSHEIDALRADVIKLQKIMQNSPDINSVKTSIDNLATRVERAQSKIDATSDTLSNLDKRLWNAVTQIFSINQRFTTIGTFNPTSAGFQFINTSYGNLLVSLKNIERLGNGYKLVFHVGNPTSVTITNLKGKISWRPVVDYQKYFADVQYQKDIDQKKRSKDFTVLSPIRPGVWNVVSIPIGPANEETIGEIELDTLDSSTVSMSVTPSN
jgi:hypothetical protein